MKYQIFLMAALVAASSAAEPQNLAEVEQPADIGEMEIIGEVGADDVKYDVQNDYYYSNKYGLQWAASAGYMAPWESYNRMLTDLSQCHREIRAMRANAARGGVEEVNKEEEGLEKEASTPTPGWQTCGGAPDRGPCRAYTTRYYFRSDTQTCERFTYGGCLGNSNNYLTKNECNRSCICKMAAEPGPCKYRTRRWYYNWLTGKCESFVYGGCGGNRNHFRSLKSCQNYCGRR